MRLIALSLMLLLAACSRRTATVEEEVKAFARLVARDITQEGPSAWRRHFADTPAFFMAAEGRMVFPDSASTTAGIQQLTRMIKPIELQWGDDLRVDVLTADLAVLASKYHEVRVSSEGARVVEDGYFTGVTERRDGRWQIRNAHWSVAAPTPPVP